MSSLYDLLSSSDKENKSLGKELFDNLDQKGLNKFIDYYLTQPFNNRIPNYIRLKIVKINYIRK